MIGSRAARVGGALLAALGLLAASTAEVPAVAPATARDGSLVAAGGYVGDDGDPAHRPVYLSVRNDGPVPELLQAAVSSAARSATWIMSRRTLSPAELENLADTCGSDPRLLAAASRVASTSSDLWVPAHGTLVLSPGVGRLQLNDPLGNLGPRVDLDLYWLSGRVLHLRLPVQPGFRPDPVTEPA